MGIHKTSLLEEIYIEGGPGSASNQKLYNSWEHKNQADNIYNSDYFYDQFTYLHGGVKLNVHPNISIYQGYSIVSAPYEKRIRYYNDSVITYSATSIQHEYYGNFEIGLPCGLKITPAYHFIWLRYDTQRDRYDSTTYDLAIDTTSVSKNNYVMSLSIRKEVSLFAFEINGSYGDFGIKNVSQLGVFGYIYPFGNLSFYSQTGLINSWNRNDHSLIFHQMLGVRLSPELWLEGEATIGNLQDYAEKNAFVIYNAPEKINYKFEATILYNMNKHLDLSLRYRLMERENTYYKFKDTQSIVTETTAYPFHTIIVGIKWRF